MLQLDEYEESHVEALMLAAQRARPVLDVIAHDPYFWLRSSRPFGVARQLYGTGSPPVAWDRVGDSISVGDVMIAGTVGGVNRFEPWLLAAPVGLTFEDELVGRRLQPVDGGRAVRSSLGPWRSMAIGDGNTVRLVTRLSAIDDADGVMAHLSPYLEHTPGPLDVEALEPAELKFLLALPETLQELLRRWNGAFFNGEAGFGTGVEIRHEGAATGVGDDSLIELWGLTRTLSSSESDEIPNDLVAEAARHDDEAFLPRGLVAIGYGMQHSLVLVSVRPEDRGAVYYWDWYWQYPWKIEFFTERIKRATAAFTDLAGATDDPNHPDHDAVVEAANGATVVRLHDDFGAWVLSMEPFDDTDE